MSDLFRQHGQGMMNHDLLSDQAREQPDGAGAPIFGAGTAVLDDVDQARADEYALLASLLITPPDSGSLARLSYLSDNSDTPLGRAHIVLAQAAASYSHEAIRREYSELFIGVGRGELLPYASYYLTGFLNERPLARLRADMARFGIERAEGHPEPEDHLASVCEMMSGFACNHFAVSPDEEQDFFKRHVEPWAGRFFSDLEHAKGAKFYRSVGTVGRLFIEIESEAFAMEARQNA
ncbi:molecular chaperone TorD [Sinorhizobium medicae]|nr:molecular chaperone TorD [Sinorhizobium medicae]